MKRLLFVTVVAACSSDGPSVTLCQDDGDCGGGSVCEMRDQQSVCVAVADAPIVIGHSAAVTGTNQQLGNGSKLGIELAVAEANATGGIRGRTIEVQFRDDAYDPGLAETTARELVDATVTPGQTPTCPSTTLTTLSGTTAVSDQALARGPNAVLVMIGSVGTPSALRGAVVAIETHTPYFGAFTGTTALLRDSQAGSCAHYLFNVRASYAQEARATLELFQAKGVAGYQNLISFDQNDSYGQSGYTGLVAAYQELNGAFPANADPTNPIKRFRYTRNDDTSVPAQAVMMEAYLAQLLTDQTGTVTVGVLMTDTYGAAAALIQHVRNWQYANDSQQTMLQKATRLQLHFSNVSFANGEALGERLVAVGNVMTPTGMKPYTEGVYFSQVVPNYANDPSPIVGDYNRAIAGKEPSFLSLEAYITTRVLIAGLLAHEGPFTPDDVVATLEQLGDLPVGLDGMFGFTATNHQYGSAVWGTTMQADGSFANLYTWRAGSPIQITP